MEKRIKSENQDLMGVKVVTRNCDHDEKWKRSDRNMYLNIVMIKVLCKI